MRRRDVLATLGIVTSAGMSTDAAAIGRRFILVLAAADTLSPQFKALTWRTLIGLLAATGMRPRRGLPPDPQRHRSD